MPNLDFADADPQTVEVAIEEATALSDWTALECFPMVDDRLAFTGDSLSIGYVLACYAEDEAEMVA